MSGCDARQRVTSSAASRSAISRVSKTFGEDTDKPFLALKEISVDIQAGEFVSVVGTVRAAARAR